MTEIKLQKINFDLLYKESEAAKRIGTCPCCELDGDLSDRVLCWCGVCLKYHHDDYTHEQSNIIDYPDW